MTGIILSGGAGRRMGGREKAFLTLDGETFIQRKIRLLKPLFDELLVIVNRAELYSGIEADILEDETPGDGPLMGMYTGLKASSSDINFITSVDSPFVHTGLVEYLLSEIEDRDAHVPVWRGYLEPLYAVYRKSCIPHIKKFLGRKKIILFYDTIRLKCADETVCSSFDPNGRCFININSMDDYRMYIGEKE
jgi:molybdopterin-guanine dinucleotide biosynthesis protein A